MAAQICEYCKRKGSGCYCSPNSTCADYEPNIEVDIFDKIYPDEWKDGEFNTGFIAVGSKPKITNGSKLTIGKELQCVTIYNVDQHFNWFQKLMWKWAFGIKVEDYSEE